MLNTDDIKEFFARAIEVFAVIMLIILAIAAIGGLGWGTYILCAYLWIATGWMLSIAVGLILTAFYIAVIMAIFDVFIF